MHTFRGNKILKVIFIQKSDKSNSDTGVLKDLLKLFYSISAVSERSVHLFFTLFQALCGATEILIFLFWLLSKDERVMNDETIKWSRPHFRGEKNRCDEQTCENSSS